jgi:hypothetical protein
MNNVTVKQFLEAKGITDQEPFLYSQVIDLLEEFQVVLNLNHFVFLKNMKSDKMTLVDLDNNIVVGNYELVLPFPSKNESYESISSFPDDSFEKSNPNQDIIDEAKDFIEQPPLQPTIAKKDKSQIKPETTLFELQNILPIKCFNALLDAFKMMGRTPLSLIANIPLDNLKDINRLGAKGIAALSDVMGKAGLKFAKGKLPYNEFRELLNTNLQKK